ncbi:RagB/SusD family nutrient uptake outer membrane protein [Prevotella sp. KH2C16]|uniref:RagB/SusD family nutrient uptake outer membrane protein n=1 Tax=Prevotella sp. KH2C16 TaxID=1855325 RepID=UPI0008E9A2BE|nr:RagB/SusD family nutrient uptake outer membrane protein [Prevotella sp. KH2C16]SFG25640.1 Starch-binding associating with outer membrane [Prevotella sp. KH2C16]
MKTKILLAGLCVALVSCEDMNLIPKSEGNTESWYTTETELNLASNEFYILGYWQEPLSSAEQWSDNTTYRLVNRNPGSNGSVLDGTLNGQQYEVYALWQQSYKLIARANTMLENIHKAEGNVPEEILNRYAGEAYFARACKYADLTFFYGDVPYMEKTETITEAERQGRRPVAEVKELTYQDFDKAIASLPVSYGQSNQIHATKGVALAMKARYALYMHDYDQAEEAAKQCIDIGIYSLYPDFSELFLQKTKNVSEKIFVLPRSIENSVVLDSWIVKNGLPRNAGGYGSYNPSWDLLASYLCTDGLPIDESPLFDPHDPFKNRDPRCAKTIVAFGSEHCGYEFNPSPAARSIMNYTTGKIQANQDTRIVNQYTSYNGLLWKKGIDASWLDNGMQVEQDYTIIRYADVLLIYAEALIEQNKNLAAAADAINEVRARAYGVDKSQTDSYPAVSAQSQEQMRKAVRIERRMEFAMENQRLQDLMRWKLAEKALNGYNYIMLMDPQKELTDVVNKGNWFWGMTPQIDEDGLADFSALFNASLCTTGAKRQFPSREMLWPVPTHDMELCPNLTNNPGY